MANLLQGGRAAVVVVWERGSEGAAAEIRASEVDMVPVGMASDSRLGIEESRVLVGVSRSLV